MATKLPPICPVCEKQFTVRSNVRRHVDEVHSNHPLKEQILKRLSKMSCDQCSRTFLSADRFTKHMKNCQKDTISSSSSVTCWLCDDDKSLISKKDIIKHYVECHNIDMSVERLSFQSLEDFELWKKQMERDTVTKYVIDNRWKNSMYYLQHLKCHRDGVFKSRSKKGHVIKHFKINGHCPAKIQARQSLETGYVEVDFLGTHVGHDNRLDMIPRRQTNSYLFNNDPELDNTELFYYDEDMVSKGSDSDDPYEVLQEPLVAESAKSEEIEISEMKDRILKMMDHYLSTSTTRDQFEIIENAVFSIGSVLDSLDDDVPSAKTPEIIVNYRNVSEES